jgi:hypothetical protein
MSERKKHKWKLYKWKLVLKNGGIVTFNMPHLIGGTMEEPTEEQVRGFVNNFQTSIRDQVESCSWEFVMEYED